MDGSASDLTAMLLGSLDSVRGKQHGIETLADHGIKSSYTGALVTAAR